MDESSSQKKTKGLDGVIGINLAATGTAINTSLGKLADTEPGRIEKKIDDLGAKIERLAEQIKALQAPQQEQKIVADPANSGEPEKKPAGAQQVKAHDVIYVKKSTDFSFYS
jgi:hypothetical protein